MNRDESLIPSELRLVLGRLRPPIRSWRFWVVQFLVMAMFVAHEFGDGRLGGVHISGLDRVVPFVAFFIPILYAALSFGFWGSVATTALATALALVDVWLDAPYYSVVELGLNLFQVALFDVVSVLIGERVEAEQIARTTARAAVRGERSAKERCTDHHARRHGDHYRNQLRCEKPLQEARLAVGRRPPEPDRR